METKLSTQMRAFLDAVSGMGCMDGRCRAWTAVAVQGRLLVCMDGCWSIQNHWIWCSRGPPCVVRPRRNAHRGFQKPLENYSYCG